MWEIIQQYFSFRKIFPIQESVTGCLRDVPWKELENPVLLLNEAKMVQNRPKWKPHEN